MNNYIDENEIRKTINLIVDPGAVFEIRIPGRRTLSGYFKNSEQAIKELHRQNLTGRNVFITLQQIEPACYSREQRDQLIESKTTTSDNNIKNYNWLLIDLDPKRAAGVSSTNEELIAAGETARRVNSWLKQQGFKDPIIAMSGNGYHLLYKIQVTSNATNKSLIEKTLKALDMLFSTEEVEVDTSVFNPARISKLYGTVAQKGSNTEERPHRMSRIVRAPETVETNNVELLESVAALLPKEERKQNSYNSNVNSTFNVYDFLNDKGIRYTEKSGDGYTKLILDECVFNPDHKAPDAAVFVYNNGTLGYKCLHNSCSGNHWREFRLKLDPAAYDFTPKKDNYTERATRNAEPTTIEEAPAQGLPGLLTYEAAVNTFSTANDKYIEMAKFPEFCKRAKIKTHDSVVIAADTGAGKSSLALNFIDNLNDEYPVIYFNLEMDELTALRRLVSIRTGVDLDRIEGYQHDENTAELVNSALKRITGRQPLQIIQDKYEIRDIEAEIKRATQGREEPTVVVIDHSLLVTTEDSFSRYERFTQISEDLRKISRLNNVIMFILLQQNRSGKEDETKRPTNSSLKESGSWENDATQIIFLWYDPEERIKKMLLTKNRGGITGEFNLEYYSTTQFYKEAKEQPADAGSRPAKQKRNKRDQERDQLKAWYEKAYIATGGQVTLFDLAEIAGTTTAAVKRKLKEFGGYIVDGEQYDAAGIDTDIEKAAFIRLTMSETPAFEDNGISDIY